MRRNDNLTATRSSKPEELETRDDFHMGRETGTFGLLVLFVIITLIGGLSLCMLLSGFIRVLSG